MKVSTWRARLERDGSIEFSPGNNEVTVVSDVVGIKREALGCPISEFETYRRWKDRSSPASDLRAEVAREIQPFKVRSRMIWSCQHKRLGSSFDARHSDCWNMLINEVSGGVRSGDIDVVDRQFVNLKIFNCKLSTLDIHR